MRQPGAGWLLLSVGCVCVGGGGGRLAHHRLLHPPLRRTPHARVDRGLSTRTDTRQTGRRQCTPPAQRRGDADQTSKPPAAFCSPLAWATGLG
jgi:hypothetical protein